MFNSVWKQERGRCDYFSAHSLRNIAFHFWNMFRVNFWTYPLQLVGLTTHLVQKGAWTSGDRFYNTLKGRVVRNSTYLSVSFVQYFWGHPYEKSECSVMAVMLTLAQKRKSNYPIMLSKPWSKYSFYCLPMITFNLNVYRCIYLKFLHLFPT